MPFCRRCGKQLPSDATFCSECGAPVAAPAPLQAISPAKPESKTTRNIVIAVVLISLLLVVGGLGYMILRNALTFTPIEESPVIGYYHYWHYSTTFQEGLSIHVTVIVEEGGPIDVLLMDSGQFLEFQRFMESQTQSFRDFKAGSALNVKHISFTFTFPSTDRYFIVLNNADGIEGGAVPVGQVTVYIKIVVSP